MANYYGDHCTSGARSLLFFNAASRIDIYQYLGILHDDGGVFQSIGIPYIQRASHNYDNSGMVANYIDDEGDTSDKSESGGQIYKTPRDKRVRNQLIIPFFPIINHIWINIIVHYDRNI